VLWLRELGIDSIDVRLNSLGGAGTRARYRDALVTHLTPLAEKLSDHARRRLADNPLRILDSKDPRDREAVASAPSILDVLEADDQAHFARVRAALDALGTPYTVDPTLVRGLDYYTRTLFEFTSAAGELGSQNSLLGGGRYDGMLKGLGGPEIPAIGFAVGLERVLLAMGSAAPARPRSCFIAPLGEAAALEALRIARELREAGLRTDVDGRGGSLKSMLRRADALGARCCLVLGDTEIARGIVQVKDLDRHSQAEVLRADVRQHVQSVLGADEATR